jgi:hypothetical protein
MRFFDPIDINLFNLGDLPTFSSRDVTSAITTFSVDFSLSGSSQLAVGLIDPNFAMASANYFQIRRDIYYRSERFEISAVETSPSESIHPLYNLECRSKYVQLMKRDKKPEAYRGMSAYNFAAAIADRYKMNFVGERTTKKQAIVKGKSNNSDDSVWTVLQSLASEQQFVCFESVGTLFFCSEKFLLGKWGDERFTYGDLKFIPFFWPETTDPVFASAKDKYILMDQPTVRRSDDDIKAADGSMLVDRVNGTILRPGMTIYLGGIPDFEGLYLITDVSFQEGSPEPVQVQFRTPVDPKKENISSSRASGGTSAAGAGTNQPFTLGRLPALNAAGSQRYTVQALSKMQYSGRNSNIIIKAVTAAVGKLNLKQPIADIERFLREYPGLSLAEREIAKNIYVHYALGLPDSAFAVAGGQSSTALLEKNLQYEAAYTTRATNPTPTNRSSTVTADTASRTAEALTGPGATTRNIIPTQPLPSSVATNINSYLTKNKPSSVTAAQLTDIKGEVYDKAVSMWKKSRSGRVSDYKSLHKSWSGVTSRFKYNALRQTSVFDVLVPAASSSLVPTYGFAVSDDDRNAIPGMYTL